MSKQRVETQELIVIKSLGKMYLIRFFVELKFSVALQHAQQEIYSHSLKIDKCGSYYVF